MQRFLTAKDRPVGLIMTGVQVGPLVTSLTCVL